MTIAACRWAQASDRGRRQPDQDRSGHGRRSGQNARPAQHLDLEHRSSGQTATSSSRRSTRTRPPRRRLIASLAKVMKDDAILASNTSTISITRLAELCPAPRAVRRDALLQPGRPDGAGRGDPGSEKTSDETIASVVALAKQIRKTPIVVKDCAGFPGQPGADLPYMNEALTLLQRRGADGRDRRGGDPVRDADGTDRACTT